MRSVDFDCSLLPATTHVNGTNRPDGTVRRPLKRAKIGVMKFPKPISGLVLATGALAQNSILEAIGNLNSTEFLRNNQRKQVEVAAPAAASEEASAETERIKLETLPESPGAQTAGKGKRPVDLGSEARAREAKLADSRHQTRIEHLRVLAMKAREKHVDFDETIRHLSSPISEAMAEAILDSELGAEIVYWLGKHPLDCKLIGDLQPLSAVREIGRIEGTITPLAP